MKKMKSILSLVMALCMIFAMLPMTVGAAGATVLGDANGDSVVDNVDAMLVLQHAVGLNQLDAKIAAGCDVNGDGSVDNVDAMQILQHAVGLLTKFPAEDMVQPAQEISLWTYPIGNWGDKETVDSLVADFEAATGIKVNVVILDYMTGAEKLDQALEGRTVDLVMEGPELLVSSMGSMGLMVDLSDMIDSTDKAEIYPAALAAGTSADGAIYEYPLAGTVHTMAINKTVFEAAGAMQYINEDTRTWKSTADFLKAVETVYAYTGRRVGSVYCGSRGGDQGTRALVTNLYGGSYTDAAHTQYTWNTPEMTQALQALVDCEGIEFDAGVAGGDEIQMLLEGKASINFCWNVDQQKMSNKTNSGDEIMFLAFPSDETPQLQGGVWGFGVVDSGDEARIKAAKEFVKYMCDSEATADAVEATGYFALRDSAEGADLTGIWAKDELMNAYSKLMPMLGDYYMVTPRWSEAREAWVSLLQAVAGGMDVSLAATLWTDVANGNDPDTPVEKTEVSVIAAMYSEQSADWWAELETAFERENQDIDLVVDVVSWNDIYTVVNTRIANGEAPDVLNIDDFAGYQADGLLLPVQDYLSEGLYNNFYSAYLQESVADGKIWAVPDLASVRVLHYNTDLFERAGIPVPTNWTELERACSDIAKFYGGEIAPLGIDMTGDEGQATFALYTWGNGGGFVDEKGNWALNSAENVEAVEYAVKLVKDGLTNSDPANQSRYDLQQMFANGQVAMIIAPDSFSPAWFDSDVNSGIAMIPANEGHDSASIGVMDRFMCFDNDYSEAELAAVTKFFDFFYEDARYLDWTQMEGFLPATKGAANVAVEKGTMAPAVADALEGSKFYPASKPEWWDVRNGVIDTMQQALQGGDVRQLLNQLQYSITGEEPEIPEVPADAVEISLWTYPIGDWGNQQKTEELIADFEAANPGIKVSVEYLNYANGDDKVNTAIEGGAAPDLIMEGPERLVANWGAKGLMVDLSDMFDSTDKAEIYGSFLDACTSANGAVYEYPLTGTVHTMAINKTVFEAAGAMQYINEATRTWKSTEDFLKAMETVYEYTGQRVGAVYCGGQGGDQGTRALVTNLGGKFTAEDHTFYTWISTENIAALEELVNCPGIEFDTSIVGGDEIAQFYHGNLNVAFCWNIAQQLNPNMMYTGAGKTANGDEIMFMAFPSNETPQLEGGIWGFGIFDNGDDAKIAAAKTFIKYMCDSAATVDAVRASNYFAVRTSAEGTDLSGIWADNAIMNQYTMMMPLMGDYYQVTPNWPAARTAWWNMLQEVASGANITEAIMRWDAVANDF